jgi:outer membrane protein assembly factor BamB
MQRALLAILAALAVPNAATAENWPAWRGPRGDGTSAEAIAPVRWGPQENVRWKTPVGGRGHSSPVVWDDRVFLTTCREEQRERVLLCLNRTDGKVLWERVVVTAPLEKLHPLNSFASSTPATDGRHVFVTFLADPDVQVACYDFDGRRVWLRSPGKFASRHGFCSSPALHKDLVIVNCDQDGDGYLVALDRATGAERWRTERPNKTRSYCPPLIVEAGGRTQVVLSGSKCVAAYDPDTGKQLWILDGPTEQFAASLVSGDNLLFLTAGYPTYHLMAIRPDGRGNVTDTHVVWHHDKVKPTDAAYVPAPVVRDGLLYVVADTGWASCLDARTGKRLWKERLGRRHSASPVIVGPHVYFPDDTGETWVVKAAAKYELVGRNKLGEEVFASPAVSRGQLFLRTTGHLYCIEEAGQGPRLSAPGGAARR